MYVIIVSHREVNIPNVNIFDRLQDNHIKIITNSIIPITSTAITLNNTGSSADLDSTLQPRGILVVFPTLIPQYSSHMLKLQ